jgi:hypothetical protein
MLYDTTILGRLNIRFIKVVKGIELFYKSESFLTRSLLKKGYASSIITVTNYSLSIYLKTFLPAINFYSKLISGERYNRNIVESGAKHYKAINHFWRNQITQKKTHMLQVTE